MDSNICNHPKYLEDKEGNKDDKELVGNQKKLCLETMKIGKPSDRSRKINSKEKFSLYLMVFSLITN